MKVKLDIDEKKFRRQLERGLVKKLKKATRVGMGRVILTAKSLAVRKAPRITGNLRRSILARTTGKGLDVVGILRATASYARYVHDGTGVYGPRKTPIRRGSRTSRGQKPQPFFRDAIEEVAPRAQQIFSEAFRKALR